MVGPTPSCHLCRVSCHKLDTTGTCPAVGGGSLAPGWAWPTLQSLRVAGGPWAAQLPWVGAGATVVSLGVMGTGQLLCPVEEWGGVV